jgi:hypothetical protein
VIEHNCDVRSDSSQYPVVLWVGGTRTGAYTVVIYIYCFVFQGNGITELEHSNVHSSGTHNKTNKTRPYKFTSRVELILMVLLKHYHYIFFSPLKFSCQMNDEHSIVHLSSPLHDRLCLREEWLAFPAKYISRQLDVVWLCLAQPTDWFYWF